MAVVVTSGLAKLVAGVRAYFLANGVNALVEVGAKKLAQQAQGPGGANRVVFVPFDPKSGAGGQFSPPGHMGSFDVEREADDPDDPPVRVASLRTLADWQRQMLISVWARDAANPEDELAHAVAVEDLVEKTMQAIFATGLADVGFGRADWIVPKERMFGFEVRMGLSFTHPICDRPEEVGYPEFATVEKA